MKKGHRLFHKNTLLKPTFKISHYTEPQQQKFLTMFNFQHSQITQNEFEKLADLLLLPHLNLTLEKKNSTLHLTLKSDAVFKKQRASKSPIHLHDKVNRLLDILE